MMLHDAWVHVRTHTTTCVRVCVYTSEPACTRVHSCMAWFSGYEHVTSCNIYVYACNGRNRHIQMHAGRHAQPGLHMSARLPDRPMAPVCMCRFIACMSEGRRHLCLQFVFIEVCMCASAFVCTCRGMFGRSIGLPRMLVCTSRLLACSLSLSLSLLCCLLACGAFGKCFASLSLSVRPAAGAVVSGLGGRCGAKPGSRA